jgi:hypothetical protein
MRLAANRKEPDRLVATEAKGTSPAGASVSPARLQAMPLVSFGSLFESESGPRCLADFLRVSLVAGAL